MATGGETTTFGEMLDAALKGANVSIRELARRLGGDGQIETQRRALGRYLGDEIRPRQPTARKIAGVLGLPKDHFERVYPETGQRPRSTTKQLLVIEQLVMELRELMTEQTTINAAATADLEGRLEEVAGLVAEGLARVEAGVADVARRLSPEEHPGHSGSA